MGVRPVWVSGPEVPDGVGAHRFTGGSRPLHRGERMFTFVVGYDVLHGPGYEAP
ncbi:hypothetical protein ACL02U_09165 [Streptomyces sp. MS06]|uniref:hypothetical protein n=1 Tax=Streptomyces sp. MS06 TaxID=3385974 RepID=UPI0039A3868D